VYTAVGVVTWVKKEEKASKPGEERRGVWAAESLEDGAEGQLMGEVTAIYLCNSYEWSSLDFPRFVPRLKVPRLHRAPDSAEEAPRCGCSKMSTQFGLSKP
jgi:hypothetical protein